MLIVIAAQNRKHVAGSAQLKLVPVCWIEESGDLVFQSRLKSNFTTSTSNRSFSSTAPKPGRWQKPFKTSRIYAFDICARRILRTAYTDHATNVSVRLRAGSQPQLPQLIQTRRLRFFGLVARMDTSLDITIALNPWAAQGMEASPVEICPGSSTLEAFRVNGYTLQPGACSWWWWWRR